MKIIYKPIENYEGLYEVSNTGIVRAIDRYNVDKNGKKKFYPGRVLKVDKTAHTHTTYLRVTLSKHGVTEKHSVHRLVASAFIPNADQTLHVNHIDNNGSNNLASNLEWVTHSANMLHAEKQGRLKAAQSKGGKASGKTHQLKAKERILSMIGDRSGLWEVIGYHGLKGTKQHALCKCHGCGVEKPVYVYSIQSNKSVGCVSCVRTKKKI